MKRLLHLGCGPQNKSSLHGFAGAEWAETRLDIDPGVQPDILGSMTDMSGIPGGSFDALYSSHSIEHVYPHEVPGIFAEFARVLTEGGFAVITCPDLQSVCEHVARGNLTEPLYVSGMGPIAAIDMLYGHRASMADGNHYMAHRGGFTHVSLAEQLSAAGFRASIVLQRPQHFDLWAIAWKIDLPEAVAGQQAQRFFPPNAYVGARTLLQRQEHLDGQFAEGLQLIRQNRAEDALAFYDQALVAASDASTRAYLLGFQALLLNCLGQVDASLELTRQALALDVTQLSALCSRAYAFLLKQDFQGCLECCDQGLVFYPDRIELLHNRTSALSGLSRNEEALATSERILALHPDDARALNNSAVILDRLGRYEESLGRYKRAVALDPDEPWALGALLTAQLRVFDWDGLDALLGRIADHVAHGKPAIEPFRYLPACDDPRQQLDAAKIYVAKHSLQLKQPPVLERAGTRHERIRIGYFSSDFRSHPVLELMAEVFELHDRRQFETHAFSLLDDPGDPAQARARAAFDHFHHVDGMATDEIIALARRMELDIAVDLNGHTLGARPAVLASRVAPVQIAYLGFPASMGAGYIDYILADKVLIPATHRHFYTEKVISLADSFQPCDRRRVQSDELPTRKDHGLPAQGFVYACFNAPMKLQPAMFERWVRILKAVEGSVLWLYDGGSDSARQRLRHEAAKRGLDPERLVFAPRLPLPEHLARHHCADLFLDTLPFNAGATASCALWCGLPVLTVSGDTFASRYGASLLTALGLPELIAPDLDAYEAMAIELARVPGKLPAIKRQLQQAEQASALLFDTPRFVRQLEAAYRTVWQRYSDGLPPDHIDMPALP